MTGCTSESEDGGGAGDVDDLALAVGSDQGEAPPGVRLAGRMLGPSDRVTANLSRSERKMLTGLVGSHDLSEQASLSVGMLL